MKTKHHLSNGLDIGL